MNMYIIHAQFVKFQGDNDSLKTRLDQLIPLV